MIPRGKGIGVANWLVSKTSGMLDAKLSRRSFISRATLVGTAVAAVGCREVALEPGTPFGAVVRVSDCPPFTLCRDGYTEFCCVINGGVNSCPPNTIPAGWWRADYSVFCDGTRYYIDCNEICCGPRRKDGFCASCYPCVCGNGCDTRKVHCNYFRYGQCNQFLAHVGPIACRMVTCVPPYLLDIGCTPSGAVDNSTAGHFAYCDVAPPPPSGGGGGGGGGGGAPVPPPVPLASVLPTIGGAVTSVAGVTNAFARHTNGNLWTTVEEVGGWSPWTDLGVAVTSGGTAFLDGADNLRVLFRLPNRDLGEIRHNGTSWSAPTDLGAPITSDPVAITFGGSVYMFARASDNAIWFRVLTGSTWSAWTQRMTSATSTPAVAATGSTLFVFARLSDQALWCTSLTGGTWSTVASLGGAVASDPSAVANGSNVFAFVRWSDNRLRYKRFDGTTWDALWDDTLGGDLASDPVAAVFGGDVFVFARFSDNTLQYQRLTAGVWSGWSSLGGTVGSDAVQVLDGSILRVFAAFTDNHLWHRSFDGTSWSPAWEDLGGTLALQRGT